MAMVVFNESYGGSDRRFQVGDPGRRIKDLLARFFIVCSCGFDTFNNRNKTFPENRKNLCGCDLEQPRGESLESRGQSRETTLILALVTGL